MMEIANAGQKLRKRSVVCFACLLFSLAACESYPGTGPGNTPLIQSGNPVASSQGISQPMVSEPGQPAVLPMTYTYQTGTRNLKSGSLSCVIQSVVLVDDVAELPNPAGFISDAAVTIQDGEEYLDLRYPDFIQDQGKLLPGVYLVLLNLTVTSQDAVCYTNLERDENNRPLGLYADPYIFRADSLVYLQDLAPGVDLYWLIAYFDALGRQPEHPSAFRLEPGESRTFTLGFLVSDIERGGVIHLDQLYLTTSKITQADEALIHLNLSGEAVS